MNRSREVIIIKRRAAKSYLPREHLSPISFGHKTARYKSVGFKSQGASRKQLQQNFDSPADCSLLDETAICLAVPATNSNQKGEIDEENLAARSLPSSRGWNIES